MLLLLRYLKRDQVNQIVPLQDNTKERSFWGIKDYLDNYCPPLPWLHPWFMKKILLKLGICKHFFLSGDLKVWLQNELILWLNKLWKAIWLLINHQSKGEEKFCTHSFRFVLMSLYHLKEDQRNMITYGPLSLIFKAGMNYS